jgi:hypothetical protein
MTPFIACRSLHNSDLLEARRPRDVGLFPSVIEPSGTVDDHISATAYLANTGSEPVFTAGNPIERHLTGDGRGNAFFGTARLFLSYPGRRDHADKILPMEIGLLERFGVDPR